MPFLDRADAGRRLADRLADLAELAAGAPHRAGDVPTNGGGPAGLIVLGLPRGGVPVALEVARRLDAPLDVVLVRKLGVPFQPELAMGAIGEGGVRVLNREVVEAGRVTAAQLASVEATERAELERRARLFRRGLPAGTIAGRVAVVVDDGLATGSTARAACQVVRRRGASSVVLAVPVAPAGWTARLADVADRLVCVEAPTSFSAIGERYEDFRQTTDEEVIACLQAARGGRA